MCDVMLKTGEVRGGAEGDRTPGLRIANAALCQTELLPHAEQHIRELRETLSNKAANRRLCQIRQLIGGCFK